MSGGLRFIKVSDDDDGQRLDRWVKKCVPEMPYALAQKLMRKGQIRVDGKRSKPDTKLQAGQEVKIPPFQVGKKTDSSKKPRLNADDAAFMRGLILYEDQDVIVINKPHGLASQGGTKTKRHIDGLLETLKDKEGVVPRLVHRLDKETSGVMVLARSAKVARILGKSFKDRNVKKIYWTIVSSVPEVQEGTISAPIIKSSGNYEKMVIDEEEGKHAVTEYSVLENAGNAAAFVAFWPRTGRTHQIRVHAAQALGVTIIGDHKYKAKIDEESKLLQADLGAMNLADCLHLHARRIILPHPTRSRQMLDVTAPLSSELVKSWKSLGFNHKYKQDPFEALE